MMQSYHGSVVYIPVCKQQNNHELGLFFQVDLPKLKTRLPHKRHPLASHVNNAWPTPLRNALSIDLCLETLSMGAPGGAVQGSCREGGQDRRCTSAGSAPHARCCDRGPAPPGRVAASAPAPFAGPTAPQLRAPTSILVEVLAFLASNTSCQCDFGAILCLSLPASCVALCFAASHALTIYHLCRRQEAQTGRASQESHSARQAEHLLRRIGR